jgi:hypothetical protein
VCQCVGCRALATLFGTLQLARAIDDPELVEQLLAQGRGNVMELLDRAASNSDQA